MSDEATRLLRELVESFRGPDDPNADPHRFILAMKAARKFIARAPAEAPPREPTDDALEKLWRLFLKHSNDDRLMAWDGFENAMDEVPERRDYERLSWCETNSAYLMPTPAGWGVYSNRGEECVYLGSGQSQRTAIDAAIAEGKPSE